MRFLAITLLFFAVTANADTIEALCQSSDNDTYIAVWKGDEPYLQVTGSLDLGKVAIDLQPQRITIVSPRLMEPIVITRGTSIVEIGGVGFDCEY